MVKSMRILRRAAFAALALLALFAVFACTACTADDNEKDNDMQKIDVTLEPAGSIYCAWSVPDGAEAGTEYKVALILKDGSTASEFTTLANNALLFDYAAHYLQEHGGTDISFSVKVQAVKDGRAFAEGKSEAYDLTALIPDSGERTVGNDIALDDILSFSYTGSADYIDGNFGFYVYKATYGADFEYSWFDEGDHIEGEATLTEADWDELMGLLNGLKLSAKSFADPEIHMLDGSESAMRISWLDMASEDGMTELKPDGDTVKEIEAWLKDKAAN